MKSPEHPNQSLTSNEKRPNPNKLEIYKEMCGGIPNAIFVLASTIVTNEKTGKSKSGSYNDVDPHKHMSGGHARSIAGAELSKFFPEARVVALSTLPPIKGEPGKPLAEVITKELQHYGVDEEKITLYKDSYSTFTELIGLIRLAVQNNWKHVVVVTNEYHIERAKLLLEKIETIKDNNESYIKAWNDASMNELLPKYKGLNPKVTFVSAESVLSIRSHHYDTLVEKAKTTELYKKRVRAERKVMQHLEDGTYGKPGKKATTFIEHPE